MATLHGISRIVLLVAGAAALAAPLAAQEEDDLDEGRTLPWRDVAVTGGGGGGGW